jgi:hypothetical protein
VQAPRHTADTVGALDLCWSALELSALAEVSIRLPPDHLGRLYRSRVRTHRPASSSRDSTGAIANAGGTSAARSRALRLAFGCPGGSGSPTRESDRATSGRMPGVVQAQVRMKTDEAARERVQEGVARALRFGTPDHQSAISCVMSVPPGSYVASGFSGRTTGHRDTKTRRFPCTRCSAQALACASDRLDD